MSLEEPKIGCWRMLNYRWRWRRSSSLPCQLRSPPRKGSRCSRRGPRAPALWSDSPAAYWSVGLWSVINNLSYCTTRYLSLPGLPVNRRLRITARHIARHFEGGLWWHAERLALHNFYRRAFGLNIRVLNNLPMNPLERVPTRRLSGDRDRIREGARSEAVVGSHPNRVGSVRLQSLDCWLQYWLWNLYNDGIRMWWCWRDKWAQCRTAQLLKMYG